MRISMPKYEGMLFTSLMFLLLLAGSGCGTDSVGDATNAQGSGDTADLGVTSFLSWDAVTTNADGTGLTDLAGYKLYYKLTEDDSYNNTDVVDVGNATTIGLEYVSALSSGTTYYFAVTAYDASDNESDYSKDVKATLPF